MRFDALLARAGLTAPESIADLEVSDIVCDSRRVTKNCIFICLSGTVYDGHDYMVEAIRAGAALIVAEKVRGECVGGAATIIIVNNTRHSASLLYNAWLGSPAERLKLIGITGTNGKSSVGKMIYEIFNRSGIATGLIGTLGAFSPSGQMLEYTDETASTMTTPEPRELYSLMNRMCESGAEYAVMEVSSHALAQCRVDAIEFECAVFTNLSEDHLDFHGDMNSYYKAKEKLFFMARRAVINIDDAAGRALFRSLWESGYREIFATSRKLGDFCALDEAADTNGISYFLKTHEGIYRAFLPLFGDFQLENSLQAAAAAMVCGIEPNRVVSSLALMPSVCGRMEKVCSKLRQDISIYIDYAHTPDALLRLLHSARKIRGDGSDSGRIILLFGCGGDRERQKRKEMGRIASALADFTVITSDNPRSEEPRSIIDDILRGFDKEKEFAVIEDRREAIEWAVRELARPHDILLLAGKGHEKYSIDRGGKHPFDERDILRSLRDR